MHRGRFVRKIVVAVSDLYMRTEAYYLFSDLGLETYNNTYAKDHNDHAESNTCGSKNYDRLRKAIRFFATFGNPFSYEIRGVQ